ncbi:hypothetical protein FPANT_7541 [Fusarium pseudoanthophilum]|uniref:Uncharacterized protein n=1 Tax=Fusarium pseudoanthophilum TaxID=48495 RepID=A0A8H5L2Y9_9HYPO|nr:hypothetical protein FPANT_7541 [Fusarium pseudoanthophilum]
MGKLTGQGHQIKFNGKLLSELATKTSRRVHWLPQDRVKMEQWLRANRTTAFLQDTSDTCLYQLALAIGLDFRRLNKEQKTLVKAKMRSSLKYTLNKLKVSGEVSERWDPCGKQVVLDWTQSESHSLRGIRNGLNSSPCAAPPTHHLTPPVLPTYDHRSRTPVTSNTALSRHISQKHPTASNSAVQSDSLEDGLDREPEDFYRQNDHLDQPPPYSVRANFVDIDLERATEEFYRQKAQLDKFEDIITQRYKTKNQDTIAASAVRDTRKLSDREVEIPMGRRQAARKDTPTTDRTLARGGDRINPKPYKISSRPLTLEMAERKSPALLESDSTKAHRRFIQELRHGSHIPDPRSNNAKVMIPAADEAIWTRADEHFKQRLVNTSVPDTLPVRRRSGRDHTALRRQDRSDHKAAQRPSQSDLKSMSQQPRTIAFKESSPIYLHHDLVKGVDRTVMFCLGLLLAWFIVCYLFGA